MTKYYLKSTAMSDELKDSIKESFKIASENVDKAEALVRALDLTDFELSILAKRISEE